MRKSIDFLNNSKDVAILGFWDRQLKILEEISKSTVAESRVWYEATPSSTREATGVVDVALISYLMRHFRLGSELWISQFVLAFRF